jgi:sugar phosphate isomerase/epimerase
MIEAKKVSAPKIGLSMLYCLDKPFREMVKLLPVAPTHYIEILDEGTHTLSRQRVKILKETAKSYGLRYSVHAPFADINIAATSEPLLSAMVKRLLESLTHSSMLEAYMWVFHPGMASLFYPQQDWKQNLKSIERVSKAADDHGLDIALENVPEPIPFLMKSVEDFEKFYADSGLDIGIALDVGHSNVNKQTAMFLKRFPRKILHVHASDNRGERDEHLGIGYGIIDWKEVAEHFKYIHYDKAIVVESVEHVSEGVETLRRLFS